MRALAVIGVLGLAACASAPEVASEDIVDLTPQEDPWALALEAERYSVLLGLAKEGVIEANFAREDRYADDLSERARRALHEGARELYDIRERACATGLVGVEDCGELAPPAWLGEPADARVDGGELRRRIDWLTEAMAPFVAAGCDAGEAARLADPEAGPDADSGPHYCSVE